MSVGRGAAHLTRSNNGLGPMAGEEGFEIFNLLIQSDARYH
jgi:Ran GTPase-activating protein (RanGAP) involved in mRNA processing and transport